MAITKISLFLIYILCGMHDHICLYMRVQDNVGINVWPQFVDF